MRALIVGAGAVGQVYGEALARGGAEVSVFVRPRHEAAARAGYRMFRIDLLGRRSETWFRPDAVVTTPADVAAGRYDQIWLCVPTDALVGGGLDPLLAASADATLVCLAPGLDVKAQLARDVGLARIVWGVIGFQSYASPLAGSTADVVPWPAGSSA